MLMMSIAVTLFLVFDPFGNLPIFAAELKGVESKRQLVVVGREMLISLVILILFLLAGKFILKLLQVSQSSLGIGGGIILLLIAIKMIFPGEGEGATENKKSEPLIVPLAVPLVAGPASIATIILIRGKYPDQLGACLLALLLSWAAAAVILMFTYPLSKFLGEKILTAGERLMGMLLTAVAIEMLINGIKLAFAIG